MANLRLPHGLHGKGIKVRAASDRLTTKEAVVGRTRSSVAMARASALADVTFSTQPSAAPEGVTSSPTILLAGDEPETLRKIRRTLLGGGYVVVVEPDLDRFASAVRTIQPQALVLVFDAESSTGVIVLEQIEALDTPTVVLIPPGDQSILAGVNHKNVAAILHTPPQAEALLSAVHVALWKSSSKVARPHLVLVK